MADRSLTQESPADPQSAPDRSPLDYPIATAPEIGDGLSVEVAPGVHWLRMPLGSDLSDINVWALADGDGWTIIDTGLRTPETVEAWHLTFARTLGGRPIRRIIVTHLHPDHCGMAGWLASRSGASLWMTRLEYLMLRVLANDVAREAPVEGVNFYHSAGWDGPSLDRYRARFGAFGKFLYPIPDAFRRIAHGDRIMIGEHEWQIVVGAGHSPEHACLYCPELNLLITGDQVLPRISSNVSVQPLEPEADPLSDWLRSLSDIKRQIPDAVLALPSHGEPFVGLHRRIDHLIEKHEESLARLTDTLREPCRAVDIFTILFRRPITPGLQGMATGESLAHLHCLRTRGIAKRQIDADGVAWWSLAAEASCSA